MSRSALILFAKAAEPGRVKTRLSPPLTPEQAAGVYRGFLRDAECQFRSPGADVRWYLDGHDEVGLRSIIGNDADVYPQRGDDLGQRMLNAFAETVAAGYDRIVIVGTDMPTLPKAYIELAFKELSTRRTVVIGPSEDGGYYLLGMNHVYAHLFDGLTYSHGRVFDEAVDRVSALDAGLVVLPVWYDVDTADDLWRLTRDLVDDPDAAPHTRAALAELGLFPDEAAR